MQRGSQRLQMRRSPSKRKDVYKRQGRKNGGDHMDILRIAALGTAGVLLGITVKGAKPEFALLVTVGAGLCILCLLYTSRCV